MSAFFTSTNALSLQYMTLSSEWTLNYVNPTKISADFINDNHIKINSFLL